MTETAETPTLRYRARDLGGDVFAGLTLWAVFSAQALAYSSLAHAAPAAGLVTGVAGALLYAALGSSRRISIGPAGGIAATVGAAVAGFSADRVPIALAVLTILAGVFLVVAGVARLSFVARLFPTPVFVGYLAGIGITILWGQAQTLATGGALAAAVGVAAIVLVLLLGRVAPRIPAPFVVLVLATAASMLLRLEARGVAVIGSTLGHFGTFAWPSSATWSEVRELIVPAMSLALLVYVDALANGETLAKHGDPQIEPRHEFFALGAASLISGLWGGFTPGCSSSRSVVGIRAGERTRFAGAIAGLLLLLTALSIVRFLAPMPLAALAGVVFVAAIGLVDVKRLREMWSLRRVDFVVALVTGVTVIALGAIPGVLVGVAAALAETLRRGMQPNRGVLTSETSDHYYDTFSPEVVRRAGEMLVYRFGAPIFFANAEVFLEDMRTIAASAGPTLRTIVVNADALGIPDATARDALKRSQDLLTEKNIELVFGNARAPLREALAKVGTFRLIDEREFIRDLRLVRPAPAI